jgi:plasmid stabilization system protein ParE
LTRYTVNVNPQALEDIDSIILYIARDSIANALNWQARLLDAIDRIGEHPGHSIDEFASDMLQRTVRKTNFERTYLIYYTLNEAAGILEVIAVFHGAREPDFHGRG